MNSSRIKARAQGTALTYRVARLLGVPHLAAAWGAARYLLTGRSGRVKTKDTQWRVTP